MLYSDRFYSYRGHEYEHLRFNILLEINCYFLIKYDIVNTQVFDHYCHNALKFVTFSISPPPLLITPSSHLSPPLAPSVSLSLSI